MTDNTLAQTGQRFTLFRVHADGSMEEVGRPVTFSEGWQDGTHEAHANRDAAFSLYSGMGRVARFCHHRLAANDATVNLDALTLL